MISVMESKDCCGCAACQGICPVKAIIMIEDREGFMYPNVDESKCIRCGMCEQVCPVFNEVEFNTKPDIYGVQLGNKEVLNRSQSGGAFWAIAQYVLDLGGVVYGAGFDENLRVVHKRAVTYEDAHEFHGSKYVQTDMRNILIKLKSDLDSGRFVLFSGTACHIAGVYRFLHKKYDKLITCDFICHGVPSPLLLKKYLEYVETTQKKSVKKFYFGYYNADEGYTWEDPRNEYIVLDDGKSYRSNKYIGLFSSNAFLRPYCHKCPYSKIDRVADFTLADYWGLSEDDRLFDRNRGVSLMFVNNAKAKLIFTEFKDSIVSAQANIESILKYQANIKAPSTPNKRRSLIFNKLIRNGFMSAYLTDKFFYKLYCLKKSLLKGKNK